MTIKALLFDKDGTLVDFALTWNGAIANVIGTLSAGDADTARRLAESLHFDLESAELQATSPFIAGSLPELLPLWARDLAREPDDAFHEHVAGLFDRGALDFAAPIGDPHHVLSRLKEAGYRLGIVTNDSETGARQQSEKLGIAGLFDAVYGYDSGHGRKPEPGAILDFLRCFDLKPEETALIGDTLHDLDAARNAGVMPIAVTSGIVTAEVLAPHAAHVIASIMDLPGLLASIEQDAAAKGTDSPG